MTLPSGLLLDLDDTIITFDAHAIIVWRAVCEEFSARHPDLPLNPMFDEILKMRRWYWSDRERHRAGRMNLEDARRSIVTQAFANLHVGSPETACQLADRFTETRDSVVDFFPGSREALDRLHALGVPMVLMTNGHAVTQRAKIDRFGLSRYFRAVLIEGELGFGKPDSRVYQLALNTLGCRPEQAWAVGDNLEWDVSGPQSLGIFGIWNDYRQRGLPPDSPHKPDHIIHSLHDLLSLV
jgi:putative hydrolase of the HAD superfamily